MSSTKSLQLSKYYKPDHGGIESVVADMSEGSSKSVTVIACSGNSGLKSEIISGVNVVRCRTLCAVASTPISPKYIYETITRLDGQIIHLHHPNPLSNLAVLFAKLLGKDVSRLVVHWHSDIVKQKGSLFWYRPLMNWMLNAAKVIITTSDVYGLNSDQLRGYEDKIRVVPIGIDSLEERVDQVKVNAIRGKYPETKIVFSLGRHIYYKGFDYLIESAKHVHGAKFLIGGGGPDTARYREKIQKLGLQEKVILIGRVADEDLPSYFAAADVFCFPSVEKSEAYGVVQLESMSVGTPVVSTNIKGSGVPWVNQHEVSGLICEPQNSQVLASTLNRILADDGLREKLSAGAKDRYKSLFTKEIMIEKIEEIYEEIDG